MKTKKEIIQEQLHQDYCNLPAEEPPCLNKEVFELSGEEVHEVFIESTLEDQKNEEHPAFPLPMEENKIANDAMRHHKNEEYWKHKFEETSQKKKHFDPIEKNDKSNLAWNVIVDKNCGHLVAFNDNMGITISGETIEELLESLCDVLSFSNEKL